MVPQTFSISHLNLNQEQKDILVGSLLGDGNLQTFSKGRTWRYRAVHQKEHRQYIEYKLKILSPLCSTGLLSLQLIDLLANGSKATRERLYFNTRVHTSLKHFANLFYRFNSNTNSFQKVIPTRLEKILTPRALAIWYQDDGALKWKNHCSALRICTESFKFEDQNRMIRVLNKLYGVSARVVPHRTRGTYRIYIPASSSLIFINLIKPYILPCMLYKLPQI